MTFCTFLEHLEKAKLLRFVHLRTKTIAKIELSITIGNIELSITILAIVFVLRLSRNSDRYAPKFVHLFCSIQSVPAQLLIKSKIRLNAERLCI